MPVAFLSKISNKLNCLDPKVQTGLTVASYPLLALINVVCLLEYYNDVAGGDLFHYAYVAFITMLANAIMGATEFIDDQAFLSLCYLLDYCQLLLPLSCITTELCIKYEVAPNELSSILAAFGIAAVLYFIICEYKRQDLADLAIISNLFVLFGVGLYNMNFFAVGASVIFATTYFLHKRQENPCIMPPQGIFNISMGLFAALSLMCFEPSFDYLTNAIDSAIKTVTGES